MFNAINPTIVYYGEEQLQCSEVQNLTRQDINGLEEVRERATGLVGQYIYKGL